MAQILVWRLDEDTKAKLQRLARRHGCSAAQEVRDILRRPSAVWTIRPRRSGFRIASPFKGVGLKDEILEFRGAACDQRNSDNDPAGYERAFSVDAKHL